MTVMANGVLEEFFHAIKYGRYETVQQHLGGMNSTDCLAALLEILNENGQNGLFFAAKIKEYSSTSSGIQCQGHALFI